MSRFPGYTPKPDEDYDVELPWVSGNYLQTLGIPLLAGRYFSSADSATATKVIIVNETLRDTSLAACRTPSATCQPARTAGNRFHDRWRSARC